ncbi:MAG: hypothetical protein M3Y08_11735 [Fibrobacterota bacterium]|nr:hypothetical protein [Fibrobacterota bacterium]
MTAVARTDRVAEWLARSRKIFTWIYCSAILFPLAFSLVATVVITVKGISHGSGPAWNGFFASFYLVLMIMLAAVPRSVLPALLFWLLFAKLWPDLDNNKISRYVGLFLLVGVALFSHSKAFETSFNYVWLWIAYLAVILPRLALPSLRGGLKNG